MEPSSTSLSTSILLSVGRIYTFIFGYVFGILIDTVMFKIHQKIKPEVVSEDNKTYLVALGLLQFVLNLLILTLLTYYQFSPGFFSLGLSLPQTNFFKDVYKPHVYYDVPSQN